MKYFIISFFFLFCLSAPSFAQEPASPEFIARYDAYVETECKNDISDIDEMNLLCLATMGMATEAYRLFYGNWIPDRRKINEQEATFALKHQALSNPTNYNERLIHYIRKFNIKHHEDFIARFEKAILWAEQEKQLSAEELYYKAHNPNINIKSEQIKERYQTAYLNLAKAKGHEQATKEREEAMERPLPDAFFEKSKIKKPDWYDD